MDWVDETMNRLPHEILDVIEPYGENQTFKLLRGDDVPVGRFEEEIGCALPGEYRDFIRRYGGASFNGSVVLPAKYHSELDDDRVSVGSFFGLYDDNAVEECTQDLRYNYRSRRDSLPPGMVPIAESGDNLFLIGCEGGNLGSVFLWMPPEFDAGKSAIYKLANSFSEFLCSLQSVS